MEITKKYVQEVRELLDHPSKWIKKTSYKEINGVPCFCLGGAISRVGSRHGIDDLYCHWSWKFRELVKNYSGGLITSFNDNPDTTHEDILNYLRVVEESLEQ